MVPAASPVVRAPPRFLAQVARETPALSPRCHRLAAARLNSGPTAALPRIAKQFDLQVRIATLALGRSVVDLRLGAERFMMSAYLLTMRPLVLRPIGGVSGKISRSTEAVNRHIIPDPMSMRMTGEGRPITAPFRPAPTVEPARARRERGVVLPLVAPSIPGLNAPTQVRTVATFRMSGKRAGVAHSDGGMVRMPLAKIRHHVAHAGHTGRCVEAEDLPEHVGSPLGNLSARSTLSSAARARSSVQVISTRGDEPSFVIEFPPWPLHEPIVAGVLSATRERYGEWQFDLETVDFLADAGAAIERVSYLIESRCLVS